MIADKRTHIENTNIEEMIDLYENMLPKQNLTNPQRVAENVLQVSINVQHVGNFNSSYIFLLQHLTKGYPDYESLAQLINKKISEGHSKITLVSNQIITAGFKQELIKSSRSKNILEFQGVEEIISAIDSVYPDYWRHSDQDLIAYEKDFEAKTIESYQIKKLVEYKAAYQKLLSIFIEPNLFLRTIDKQSTKRAFTKINLDRLIDENDRLVVLHGDPGTGKTRLLNEIGKLLIERNTKISGKRFLPVFIDTLSLRESFSPDGEFDLCSLILENKLNHHFTKKTFEEISDNYQIVLLIDSIDEFEEKYKKLILQKLELLLTKGVIAFLGTRTTSIDEMLGKTSDKNIKDVFVQKFNDQQVEKFASRYFEGKGNRAQGLLESLQENKILDKLPLTPLNLSLMSILYEETSQYEIPATINDIYDKFSNLLLGRTMADKSIDFLDITVKETILGIYALELLKRKNSELLTKEEFFTFFQDKLSSISGTIDMTLLPKALDFIIEHTGLLVLQKGKYVKFRHDSYMEYFAAKEIFKNHRELEEDLVKNFFDVNWQFAAVFYGGESRKMPEFLEKVIEKIKTASTLQEYWAATNGLGYLLQALYLTDDEIRKKGILEVLKIMVDTYQVFKKLSATSSENVILGRLPLPILSIFPIFLFQDNFDSITLKQPLSLALDDLLDLYNEKSKLEDYPYIDNIVYQILILSITVSSDRLNMEDRLEKVLDMVKTKGNEFYTKLLEAAIDNLGSKELRRQKNNILNPPKIHRNDQQKYYINKSIDIYMQPAFRQRFGKYDKITPNKKIKLFVEGTSDAIIMEHAYFVLTGHMPYWEVRVGGYDNGGASDLAKALSEGLAYMDEDQIVIGVFDNDSKGQQEFLGNLRPTKFDFVKGSNRIKKRKDGNIFGMLLPVPDHLQHYIQDKQTDNYFSIEHYFPEKHLRNATMLKTTAIPNIYEIRDSGGNKLTFARQISKINDISLFKDFIILFREIDALVGYRNEINYRE